MDSETIRRATELWNYLSSFQSIARAEAIVVCCSYDLRVCDHACDLLRQGFANKLVLTGNTGHWTRHIWSQSEAAVFRERALANGIDRSAILSEDRATNFGENIAFSRQLLGNARAVVFVTKPAAVLRVILAVNAQWPEVEAYVSCPALRFPDDVSQVVGVLGAIDEMVGDVERIQRYPELGFQAPHEFPKWILEHWEYLLEQGFTRHLMNASPKA